MRLSRIDLVPMLTIIAGGALGFSLSSRLLLSSRSESVPTPDQGNEYRHVRVYSLERIVQTEVVFDRWEEERLRERARIARISTDVEKVLARAVYLAREQRDVEATMNRLAEASDGPGSEVGRRLFERKEAMYEEIVDLEREVQRLMRETLADQREASERLGEAASTIEDDHLKERVRYSRGLIGIQDTWYIGEFEAETTRVLEELLVELESVLKSVVRPPERF